MDQVVLASNNVGKLSEFERLLAPMSVQVLPQSRFAMPECDEPFGTFVENALHKARHAARHSGLPALADDSGICVPALKGAPGVFSARYAQMRGRAQTVHLARDAQNNAQLSLDLEGFTDKRAYYYCVLVWVRHADDPQPIICDGQWWGRFVHEPQGTQGFGYDAHFWVPELGLTAAQMSPEAKNTVSHRGQAVHSLLNYLKMELGDGQCTKGD